MDQINSNKGSSLVDDSPSSIEIHQWPLDEQSLYACFEKYGEIIDSFLSKDKTANITFLDACSAAKAVFEMNGRKVSKKFIWVKVQEFGTNDEFPTLKKKIITEEEEFQAEA